MAFIPLPDGAVVVLEYGQEVSNWTNTLWFTKTAFDDTDLQTLCDTVHQHFENMAATVLSTNWELRSAVAYDMRADDGPKVYDTRSRVAGTVTGQPAAISVACCVTFYTGGRGRSQRGRNFVTGFSEDDVGPTTIVDNTITAQVSNSYNGLIAAAGAVGWTWVIAQRAASKVPLATAIPHTVTAAVVRNDVLTHQRRRIPRE